MNKYKGAITAIVTPFTKKLAVDLPALKNLVEFQIQNGIDGIVVCGSTGEAATMTNEEYSLVVNTVVKKANRRIPVIAGAGSNDTQKAIYFSKLAKKAGVDCLLHVSPYYNKPTTNGLIEHYRSISKAVNLPIILYNVPGRTGSNVLPSTIIQIVKEVPQVIGVKEASGNVMQVTKLVQKSLGKLAILSGDDALTIPMMAVGAVGCISVVANEVPKEFSQMVHFALDGNWDKAKEFHYKLLDLMDINFVETNPIPVKTALALMGKISESFRLPLIAMEPNNREKLIAVLKEGKLV